MRMPRAVLAALVALASGVVLPGGLAAAAQTTTDDVATTTAKPTTSSTRMQPPYTRSSAAGQAGRQPQFSFDGTNYISRICGIPDYDQHRTPGVLQGDGRTLKLDRYPLQGDGGCHRVPTSFTNLLGYYVSNGVVGSYPASSIGMVESAISRAPASRRVLI